MIGLAWRRHQPGEAGEREGCPLCSKNPFKFLQPPALFKIRCSTFEVEVPLWNSEYGQGGGLCRHERGEEGRRARRKGERSLPQPASALSSSCWHLPSPVPSYALSYALLCPPMPSCALLCPLLRLLLAACVLCSCWYSEKSHLSNATHGILI